jgi:putative phosphoesterase
MGLRIGVLADTHIRDDRHPLPSAMLAAFARVDAILHAGDIACRAVLDVLAAIAPVHAVHGNVDPPDLQRDLPDRLVLTLGGVPIGLTHGHLGTGHTTPDRAIANFTGVKNLQVIIFGHSHMPYSERSGDILLFNPGSPTRRRRQPWPSIGLLAAHDGVLSATVVPLYS